MTKHKIINPPSTEHKITIDSIVEILAEWRENINCDIKAEWCGEELRLESIRQSMTLSQAIGLLQSIGTNNNIPK